MELDAHTDATPQTAHGAGTRAAQDRLQRFVQALAQVAGSAADEAALLGAATPLLRGLIAHDDWLADEHAQPHPQHYRQYLLHADPAGRFSVVSFVWGPGQRTPVHDHTVWGLVGVLRGAELVQPHVLDAHGRPQAHGAERRLAPGDVDAVSPALGDIHRVRNAFDDRVSISIHVYGADIGRVQRSVYADDGTRKPFVSGYANVPAAAPAHSTAGAR